MPAREPFGRALRGVAGAIAFLTVVPIGRRTELGIDDVARGAWCFPLVGGAVGAVAAGAAWLLGLRVPALVAAAVAVAVEAGITGAMHLDALADTVDALGGRSRVRALEIMRDHSIGSFGASAIVLDLGIRIACVATILAGHRLGYVVAAEALGRGASVPLGALLPSARAEAGSGRILTDRASLAAAGVAVVLSVGVAVAVTGAGAAAPIAAALGLAAVLGLVYRRWLGGATGDTLGAAVELCGTVALIAATGVR
jgi:adenosylcobinamide-GDP ribazoletransferase